MPAAGAASASPGAAGRGALAEDDYREYSLGLGVDAERDEDLQWIVQEAFHAPVPASWTEHTDDEGRLYFFREASAESSWEHPMDGVYRELVTIVKQVRANLCEHDATSKAASCTRLVRRHLEEVHQRALEALEGWSGPYSSTEGDYYYNAHLKVSVWECPLAEWNHELTLRHSVLCRCLLPDGAVGFDGEASPPASPSGRPAPGADLLRALHLPLELLRRGDADGGDQPRTPSTSRDYQTARWRGQSQGASTSAGEDGFAEQGQRCAGVSLALQTSGFLTWRSGCSTTRSQLSTRDAEGQPVVGGTAGEHTYAAMKRSPKRSPKPPQPQEPREPGSQDTVTIFTRPS